MARRKEDVRTEGPWVQRSKLDLLKPGTLVIPSGVTVGDAGWDLGQVQERNGQAVTVRWVFACATFVEIARDIEPSQWW